MINQESIVWIMIIAVIIFLGIYNYPSSRKFFLRRNKKSLKGDAIQSSQSDTNQLIANDLENDVEQEDTNQLIANDLENDVEQIWLPITVKIPMTRTEFTKYFDKDQSIMDRDKELFISHIKDTLIEVKDIRLINRSHSLKNGYMADFEYLPVYGVHRDETGIMCDFTLSLTLHSSDNIKRTILNVFEKIGIKPEQIRYVKSTYSVYQYVTVEYWPNNAELILGPNSTIEVKKLELNLLNYDIRTALFDLYLEDKNWRLTNLFYFENPSETYPLMFTIEYWDKAKK